MAVNSMAVSCHVPALQVPATEQCGHGIKRQCSREEISSRTKKANSNGMRPDLSEENVHPPSRDWTSLPELVLDLILHRLDSAKDFLSFVLACQIWWTIAYSLWRLRKGSYGPMLLLGHQMIYYAATRMIPTRSNNSSFNWPPQWPADSAHRMLIGSSFGWFITYCPNAQEHIVIQSPRFATTLEISFKVIPSNALGGFHPVKAILSADPSKGNQNYILATLFRKSSSQYTKLMLLDVKPNAREGCSLVYSLDLVFDVACIDGNICWLEKGSYRTENLEPKGFCIAWASHGKIKKCCISVVHGHRRFKEKPPMIFNTVSTAYLVEQSGGGSPWLVIQYRMTHEDGTTVTYGFKVFEQVSPRTNWLQGETKSIWRRVRKLQNDVILIGYSSAFCVAWSGLLATGGLEPNCIYYMDALLNTGHDNNINNGNKNIAQIAPDMGVFNVEQGCLKPFPFPEEPKQLLFDAMKVHGAPVWFYSKP